jgi:hypothetical protein
VRQGVVLDAAGNVTMAGDGVRALRRDYIAFAERAGPYVVAVDALRSIATAAPPLPEVRAALEAATAAGTALADLAVAVEAAGRVGEPGRAAANLR